MIAGKRRRYTAFFLVLLLRAPSIAIAETFARLERYAVNTTIVNRFARTQIVVTAVNEGECATLLGLDLQLPVKARVKSLTMDLSDDCTISGVVKTEAEAQAEFYAKVQRGEPGAILEAFDLTNYGFQISIPALGATRVELEFEELLQRKRGKIDVTIPIFPEMAVEELVLEVTIQEQGTIQPFRMHNINEKISDFLTQSVPAGNETDVAVGVRLEVFNVPQNGRISDDVILPKILRGSYDVGALPEEGLMIPDSTGKCFVHLFNPSLLAAGRSLPRNIVFAIDVSRSTEGQKLKDAQAAVVAILDKLTDQDTFAIHKFSDQGTEDFFGPKTADQQSKNEAKVWVNALFAMKALGGTDLLEAFTDAINRVQAMQVAAYQPDNNADITRHIPIVIVLTDGQATDGVIDTAEILRSVKDANTKDGVQSAKIYGLALGEGADYSLLTGISIQNEGKAIRIHEGFGDAAFQIENFFDTELGTILASDVNVYFAGDVRVDSQTQTIYSVFSEGSEIAVRAITWETEPIVSATNLRATTIAYTADGLHTWEADLNTTGVTGDGSPNSECFRSFAHAKIADIMKFRAAAETLGNDLSTYATYYLMGNGVAWNTASNFGTDGSQDSSSKEGGQGRKLQSADFDLVERSEAQALKLAIQAGIVWPGLTAIVAQDSPACTAFAIPDAEICVEGDPVTVGGLSLLTGGPADETSGAAFSGFSQALLPSTLLVWSLYYFFFKC